ncbi:MAG TPA: MgtC/SapB family protein [Thermoleophilaceae bacterium]|nr:MgtC/SapB family protein [Thermoleophilaceae bacterium]
MLDTADYILRVAAAGGLGALIGIERESRNQLAGIRTHALVATGAAVFTIAGAFGFPGLHRGPNVDPMRVAAQIASGIGFIGAGTIIRDRGAVRGITTAAALWVSAAVGLAAGAALWGLAISGAVVTLIVLVVLRPVRARLLTFASPRCTVEVEYQRGHGTLGPLLDAVSDSGGHVDDLSIDDQVDGRRSVTLEVRVHDDEELREAIRRVSEREEVARCTVHRM